MIFKVFSKVGATTITSKNIPLGIKHGCLGCTTIQRQTIFRQDNPPRVKILLFLARQIVRRRIVGTRVNTCGNRSVGTRFFNLDLYLSSLLNLLDDNGPELPGADADADEDEESHERVQNLWMISPFKSCGKMGKKLGCFTTIKSFFFSYKTGWLFRSFAVFGWWGIYLKGWIERRKFNSRELDVSHRSPWPTERIDKNL